MTAGEIAKYAEFFSFGTNDLTQMSFGYSRDDAERTFWASMLTRVSSKRILQQLDRDGVGRLMNRAVIDGREVRPNLELVYAVSMVVTPARSSSATSLETTMSAILPSCTAGSPGCCSLP